MKTYKINKACELIKNGSFVATTTYMASTFYIKSDGSVWMNHPSYPRDRKFYKNLKEFKNFYRDSEFYEMKRQYNPKMCGRYILEESKYNNKHIYGSWSYPHYGTELRKKAMAI